MSSRTHFTLKILILLYVNSDLAQLELTKQKLSDEVASLRKDKVRIDHKAFCLAYPLCEIRLVYYAMLYSKKKQKTFC